MSNANHTPEPWTIDRWGHVSAPSCGAGSKVLCPAFASPSGNHPQADEAEANTARIVACVNALAGVPHPQEAVKAAREAMVAALGLLDTQRRQAELARPVNIDPIERGPIAMALADAVAMLTPPTPESPHA